MGQADVDHGSETRWKNRKITSRAQNKKHLSHFIRRRNAKRMDQWKAERESVGDNKTCVQTQTDEINPSTDETTQTEQLNSDAKAINILTVLTKKGASDTDKMHITNLQKNPPTLKISAKNGKTVRSPYNRMKLAYLTTTFRDGSMSLSESFDMDDPALIDRFPDYTPETDIGDRPPTPTWEISSRQRPSKKQKYLSAIPGPGRRT